MKRTISALALGLIALTGCTAQEAPAPQPLLTAPTATQEAPKPAPPSQRPTYATQAPTEDPSGPAVARVVRVVDGDTVRVNLNGREETLRLIGFDTPETVHPSKPVECMGPEASAEAKRLLTGKTVEIHTDPTQGRTDNYGRTLAYLEVDGLDFGAHMIESGLAKEYTYRRAYERQAEYRAAEDLAQSAGAGIWSQC